MVTITDCLVLKIVERDCDDSKVDTTMFVLYDTKSKNYIVRGKRSEIVGRTTNKVINPVTYSFLCDGLKDLVTFITFTICPRNLWTYGLYNHNNLHEFSEDITFEDLQKYLSVEYEVSGYNDKKFDLKELTQNLRMLKNVYNLY